MEQPLSLTKILIHSSYGAYGSFSDEFYEEFARTYDIDFQSLPSYDPDHDDKHQNEHISSRYDPRLIHIFEKLGKDRCFEKIPELPYRTSSLTIVEIPTMLLDAFYISAYDGAEWIWCNISKKYKDVLLFAINIDNDQDAYTSFSASSPDATVLRTSASGSYYTQHKLNEIARCEKFLTENDIHFV